MCRIAGSRETTRPRLAHRYSWRLPWLTTVTSAVLYEHPLAAGRLLAGVTHSRMRVRSESPNEVQRLGLVMTRQSTGQLFRLRAPSVTVGAARFLDHPSKQGQWTAFMTIGFALHR